MGSLFLTFSVQGGGRNCAPTATAQIGLKNQLYVLGRRGKCECGECHCKKEFIGSNCGERNCNITTRKHCTMNKERDFLLYRLRVVCGGRAAVPLYTRRFGRILHFHNITDDSLKMHNTVFFKGP